MGLLGSVLSISVGGLGRNRSVWSIFGLVPGFDGGGSQVGLCEWFGYVPGFGCGGSNVTLSMSLSGSGRSVGVGGSERNCSVWSKFGLVPSYGGGGSNGC